MVAKDALPGFCSGVLCTFEAGAAALTGDFLGTGAFGVVGVLGIGDLASGLGDGLEVAVGFLAVEMAAGIGFAFVAAVVGFAAGFADVVAGLLVAGPVDRGDFAAVPLVLLLDDVSTAAGLRVRPSTLFRTGASSIFSIGGDALPVADFPLTGLPFVFILSSTSCIGVDGLDSKAFSGIVSEIIALLLLASFSPTMVSFVSAISFGFESISILNADLLCVLSLLLSLRRPRPAAPPTAMKLVLTLDRGRGEVPFLLLAKRISV